MLIELTTSYLLALIHRFSCKYAVVLHSGFMISRPITRVLHFKNGRNKSALLHRIVSVRTLLPNIQLIKWKLNVFHWLRILEHVGFSLLVSNTATIIGIDYGADTGIDLII